PDDHRLAPAAMGRFQRLTHHLRIAGAVERVVGPPDLVGAALRHVDQMSHDVVADLVRIDEMRHAEPFTPGLAVIVDIDADDYVGAGKAKALQHVEADTAETEDDCGGADLYLGRVDDRADAGGHPAAD